jgi:glutamate dehydrogenase (NADP+)
MGGGKGGSDFDPKGKSDGEVMRFCQSFMAELFRHIGPRTDVPAGDIGVGGREIGYLFGYYKKLRDEFSGVLTGKGVGWGGSLIRTEATGYGLIYFAQEMLATRGEGLEGKTCLVSGSGNVAQYAVEKLIQLGAKPITMSDSDGFIVDRGGINKEKLEWVKALKNERRGRIREYADQYGAEYHTGMDVWHVAGAQCAFPCATQNEIGIEDAKTLTGNGIYLVGEGANMPSDIGAIRHFLDEGILFGPAKAANAGGVATSGLEMSQNAQHYYWTREEVDTRLHAIMVNIHLKCQETAAEFGTPGNLVNGANVAGFRQVANAMLAQGVV